MTTRTYRAGTMKEALAQVRKDNVVDFLRPDGKTQVSVEYEDGVPVRLDTVLISTQHGPGVSIENDIKPSRSASSSPES